MYCFHRNIRKEKTRMFPKNRHKIKMVLGKFPIMMGLLALAALTMLQYDASQAALPAASPGFYQENSAGTIAYVNQAQERDEIWLIEPDGSGNRRFWTPGPLGEGGGSTITGLSWRPGAGTLAFASDHEWLCSWYNADVYTVLSNGSFLRRVTNGPTCAALATYPKGTVTATIENATFSSRLFGVYIQGAPAVQTIHLGPFGSGLVTFTDVADLGDVVQPVVAIYGGYRWFGAAYANVQPGQTVHAGTLTISGTGFWHLGAYKSSWRQDGSGIGYTTTNCGTMYEISPNVPAGHIGQPILNSDEGSCVMAWGPTPATHNQILYIVDSWEDDVDGIYHATAGSSSMGTRVVPLDSFDGKRAMDVKWLPDGSGFLFTMTHWVSGDWSITDWGSRGDIFEYNFATASYTRLSNLVAEQSARSLSISPDGQHVVFELAEDMYDEATDLWIMQRNGSNMQRLVSNAGHPAWSPGALQEPVLKHVFLPVIVRQP
jgi:hypothetical protein